jgi:hypothetical protein
MQLKRVERKEVERPKEVKPPEKGKENTVTIRPRDTVPEKPGKATSADGKTQNSNLFRPQGWVTVGKAERSTERNVNKNTEKREPIKPTQKEVEKPKAYQPAQKAVEDRRENKPLVREVQRLQEARPVGREAKPKENVLTERNLEKSRASNGVGREVEKNKTFATRAAGAKTTPSLTQYGRETGGAKQTKKEIQQIPGSRISARGTGNPIL